MELDEPSPLQRASSDEFGSGASKYSQEDMDEWKRVGEAASHAFRKRDFATAEQLGNDLCRLRPDWVKGLKAGRLCDVAPTLLQLMGLAQPTEMTGCSLLDGDGLDKLAVK